MNTEDDEAAVMLDALLHWRETVASTYEPEDRKRFIAAANRIAERLGCRPVKPSPNNDGTAD